MRLSLLFLRLIDAGSGGERVGSRCSVGVRMERGDERSLPMVWHGLRMMQGDVVAEQR
jgi:hypothetical protein